MSELLTTRHLTATRVGFFTYMMAFGVWMPRLPEIKDHFGLSVAELGRILMVSGFVMFIISKPISMIIEKYGSKKSVRLASFIIAVSGTLIGLQISIPIFMIGIAIQVFGSLLVNTAINTQANSLKLSTGHDYMGNLTAIANLGALTGVAVASALIHATSPTQYILGMTLLIFATYNVISLFLNTQDLHQNEDPSKEKMPWFGPLVTPVYVAIAALFVQGLAEWSVADWGALFGRDELNLKAPTYLFIYAFFQFGIILSRFLLNKLTAKFGTARFIVVNGFLAATCWGSAIILCKSIADSSQSLTLGVILTGFFIGGFGVGPFWPAYVSAALNLGFSAPVVFSRLISILSFAAVFGPGFIGLLSRTYGLTNALLFPVFAMFIAALSAPLVVSRKEAK